MMIPKTTKSGIGGGQGRPPEQVERDSTLGCAVWGSIIVAALIAVKVAAMIGRMGG